MILVIRCVGFMLLARLRCREGGFGANEKKCFTFLNFLTKIKSSNFLKGDLGWRELRSKML
jgi:hypothetical protein